jgi:hypothetical protein
VVGNAVRDDLDFLRRHSVFSHEELAGLVGHHDDGRRNIHNSTQHSVLLRAGLRQNRVQRRDDGHRQVREQRQDVAAGIPAEDPELVLQARDFVPTGVQERSGLHVIIEVLVCDLPAHDGWVVVVTPLVRHRYDDRVRRADRGGDRLL